MSGCSSPGVAESRHPRGHGLEATCLEASAGPAVGRGDSERRRDRAGKGRDRRACPLYRDLVARAREGRASPPRGRRRDPARGVRDRQRRRERSGLRGDRRPRQRRAVLMGARRGCPVGDRARRVHRMRQGGAGGSPLSRGGAAARRRRPGPGHGRAVDGRGTRSRRGGGTPAGLDTVLVSRGSRGQRVCPADRGAVRGGGSQPDGGRARRGPFRCSDPAPLGGLPRGPDQELPRGSEAARDRPAGGAELRARRPPTPLAAVEPARRLHPTGGARAAHDLLPRRCSAPIDRAPCLLRRAGHPVRRSVLRPRHDERVRHRRVRHRPVHELAAARLRLPR